LLGVERFLLLTRRFGLFVAAGDRRAFSDFLERVFASQAKERCEVVLPREGHSPSPCGSRACAPRWAAVSRGGARHHRAQADGKADADLLARNHRRAREERKQVASVLHHDVGSMAVGLSAHLTAIERDICSGKPAQSLKWLKRTWKLLDESVMRLKGLAVDLRPPSWISRLCAACDITSLRRQSTEAPAFISRKTCGKRLSETPPRCCSGGAGGADECLKHGCAKRVDVVLRASKNELTLTVHDNGKGFDLSEQRAGQPHRWACGDAGNGASAGGSSQLIPGAGKEPRCACACHLLRHRPWQPEKTRPGCQNLLTGPLSPPAELALDNTPNSTNMERVKIIPESISNQ